MNHKKILALLILTLLTGAFLRFYRMYEMVNFDFDQQYAADFAYSVIKTYPIQLIGQGLSIQGLFMGPLYFYFLTPFFSVTSLHPIGGFIGSSILGLITIFAYFWIGNKMFGPVAGLTVAFFRSILFSYIGTDWSMTPAFSADLMVIITLYLFYLYWHGNNKSLIALFFCFGFYTSFHPILFPFYLVFLIIFFLRKKFPSFKIIAASVFAFLIPLTPLILFEFLHNFLEVKQLILLFSGSTSATEKKDLIQILISYSKVNFYEPFRIFGIQSMARDVFSSIFFIVLSLGALIKIGFWKDGFHRLVLITTTLVFILYYSLYPAHVPEYYFLAIQTLLVFYAGATISLLFKKFLYLFIMIIILLSYFNINMLSNRWQNTSTTTLANKDFIVKEIVRRQPANQEFFVSYIKYLGWNFGFDYLFKLYGRIPQTIEAKPPVYTIVLPKSLSPDSINVYSGIIGLILPR